MKFETTAIHAGRRVDPGSADIAPPIHLSTTFERSKDGGTLSGYSYIRDANPTQTQLEDALRALDGGAEALVFASGLAACAALFQTLEPGSHVILPDDGYHGVRALATDAFPSWGLTAGFAAMDDAEAIGREVNPSTRMIWGESPSNPLMKITDLRRLSQIARSAGALLVVDGTFATPALQRPIELGADVVVHSTTKYLGGHSDVQGGSLAFASGREELHRKVLRIRTITGGVASPFNSWLVLRGIRTLAARMRVHCENASAVASFLAQHKRVEAVHYPGLISDPGHAIAARQMSGFGGMLSFRVRGGAAEALGVAAKTELFARATSLGGVESLIEHRASSEGPESRTPLNLLRVSAGLEHPHDLVADLEAALQ